MATVESPQPADIPTPPEIAPLRRRMISASFWSFAGRGMAIGIFFLTDMILARALPKFQFAQMYLATGVVAFLAAFISLGTQQILRVVRQTFYGPHPERTEGVIRGCTRILLLGAGLGSTIFLIAIPFVIDERSQWQPFRDYPWGIIAWGCLSSACLNASFALQGLDDFRSAMLIGSRRGGLLPNIAFAIFAAVAWRTGFANPTTLIYAQAVLQAGSLVVAQRAIRQQLDRFIPRGAVDVEADGPSLSWLLRESLPYLAAQMSSLAMDELDAVIVGEYVTDSSLANYGGARRLVRLMSTAFVMYAVSMGPFLAELLAKNEHKKLERIMRASATLVCIPMLGIFAIYMFAPKLTLWLAFGSKFTDAATALRLLTIGQVIFVVLGNSGQTLLMAGRLKEIMWISVASLAIYWAATPLMTQYYGLAGAAIMQSVVMIGQAVATTIAAKRLVGIWTVATFSPASMRDAISAIRGRRRRKDLSPEDIQREEESSDEFLDK